MNPTEVVGGRRTTDTLSPCADQEGAIPELPPGPLMPAWLQAVNLGFPVFIVNGTLLRIVWLRQPDSVGRFSAATKCCDLCGFRSWTVAATRLLCLGARRWEVGERGLAPRPPFAILVVPTN